MARRRLASDSLLVPATCLLLLLAAGRATAALLAPEPVRARSILAADSVRFPRGRLLLLADSAGASRIAAAVAEAQRSASELPLEVRILGWDDDVRQRQLRRLVRAYGFERLPVLLTLDADARVMRVEPL